VKQPSRVLLIVSVATFMASLDLFIVNIAFPDIARSFGGESDASLSWVLNAYAIVFAALLVPAGRLADLVGRRRVFLSGMLLFTVASALCALAPSVGWLIAARALQALGGAALMPTSLALLLVAVPPERRHGAVALWAASGAVAAAAGPPLGGLLVQASWHWVFLVNLPVGLVTVIAGARTLPESRDPAARRLPDLLGAALLTAGVALFTLGLVKGPAWGWGDGATVGALAGGPLLLVAFARRCLTHPVPVIEPALLRVRSFTFASLAGFAFFSAFGAMLLGYVLFLTRVWGEDVLTAGLMIAPGPLMAAATSVPSGVLTGRWGPRAAAIPGTLLYAAGSVWWLTHLQAEPAYLTHLLPAQILGGAGVGLVIPSLSNAAAGSLPPARFATGSAVFTMSRQLGAALGVAVLVAIVGTPSPGGAVEAFHNAWLFNVAAALIAGAAAIAIGPRRSRALEVEPAAHADRGLPRLEPVEQRSGV
jgi:EmrB/QacA subfamily drug resistance transporter